MAQFILIPVTEEMITDLKECENGKTVLTTKEEAEKSTCRNGVMIWL